MTYFFDGSVNAIFGKIHIFGKNKKQLRSSEWQHIICHKRRNYQGFEKILEISKPEVTRAGNLKIRDSQSNGNPIN